MGYKTRMQLLLTFTLTLTLAMGTDGGNTDYPCPYEECTCTSSTIDCTNKGLTTLPVWKSGSFPQTYLDIRYNDIRAISGVDMAAGLESFRCTNNPLSDVTDDAFRSSAATLQHLVIMHTQLSRIPNLSYLVNLKYLGLGWNRLTDAPDVSLPDSLQRLYLGNNALAHIPAQLSTLTQLTYLYLSKNSIRDIDTFTFPSSVTMLDLSYDNIENISSIMFHNNSSALSELRLNNNPLQHISLTAFTHTAHLTDLDLSSTRLTRLPMALMTLTHLIDLDLRDISSLACTCEEKGLAVWYRAMTSLDIKGDCGDGKTVDDFLSNLALSCP